MGRSRAKLVRILLVALVVAAGLSLYRSRSLKHRGTRSGPSSSGSKRSSASSGDASSPPDSEAGVDEKGVKWELDVGLWASEGDEYLKDPEHVWKEEGLLLVEEEALIHHPIWELVQNADRIWNESVEALPRTSAAFELEYEAKTFRLPPKNLVQLFNPRAEYPSPLLHPSPFFSYFSLRPEEIRSRQRALETNPEALADALVLVVEDGRPHVEYPWNKSGRLKKLGIDLIGKIGDFSALPNLRIIVTLDSLSSPHLIPRDLLTADIDLSALGKLQADDYEFKNAATSLGWKQACDPKSSLRRERFAEEELILRAERGRGRLPSLVHEPASAFDPCKIPWLIDVHPILSGPPSEPDLRPVPRLAAARLALGGEVVVPLPLRSSAAVTVQARKPVPWSDKTGDEVYWRGKPLPLPFNLSDATTHPSAWRALLLSTTPLAPSWPPLLMTPGLESEEYGFRISPRIGGRAGHVFWKSESILDVALTEDFDCSYLEDCDKLKARLAFDLTASAEEAWGRKFRLVLEDESPLEAFMAESVVFYASLVVQPWQKWAIPWKHYIPIQPDFSDLASVLFFFRRYPGEAEQLGQTGRAFAEAMMSPEMERTVLLGTLLEWGRVLSKQERAEMAATFGRELPSAGRRAKGKA